MDRYAPGVFPGVDLTMLNLHAVRETALGALLDLLDGDPARATTALRNVLALQYPLNDRPWSGTFPVAAEQPEPPGDDAIEWVHYDPNWRQFVGCALAVCRIVGGDALAADVRSGIADALSRCVAGEPDDRIAPWYTNPNLMHAWLQGHVAATTDDRELGERAHARVELILGRFARHGDLDEYNSPTYDGIDLWALGLWATHPPSAVFADAASTMLPRVGARISTLHHPTFGTACGPYTRAYGLDPTRYVSLSGLVAAACGAPPADVLPPDIDAHTDHVHDLYFVPAIELVADALRPHLDVRPVDAERLHEQRFTGTLATSLLRPDLAVGWEAGRRHDASIHQYVPFTLHHDDAGHRSTLGVMLLADTAWVDVERVADGASDLAFDVRAGARVDRVGLRLVGDGVTCDDDGTVLVGPCRLAFDEPPVHVVERITATGTEYHLQWSAATVTGRAHLGT
jgi:hypothetical protein